MNELINKSKRIKTELIEKSFPELKNKNFRFMQYNFTKSFAGYISSFNLIGIHKRCKNLSRNELKTVIAHELCHASLSKDYNFFESFFYDFISNFSTSKRREVEVDADKLLIDKGYGKDRINLEKKIEKGKHSKFYLSAEEMKEYMKSLK